MKALSLKLEIRVSIKFLHRPYINYTYMFQLYSYKQIYSLCEIVRDCCMHNKFMLLWENLPAHLKCKNF